MGNLLEAAFEGLEMLEAEYGGRRQHRHLAAILHRLEGRAHGHFGLAVAHVAHQQAIHRQGRFHVALDVGDGRDLVLGLVVIESVFELPLKVVVYGKGMPLSCFALRVKLEQLISHVLHGLAHPRLGLGPLLAAQPVQHRSRAGIGRAVLLNQVKPGERNVEPRLLGKLQHHEFHLDAVLLNLPKPHVAGDAMLHMHYVIAYRQVTKVRNKGCRL